MSKIRSSKNISALLTGLCILFIITDNLFAERLRGTVRVDASSTIFPITEAVAEEFGKEQPRVRVTVGVSCIEVALRNLLLVK